MNDTVTTELTAHQQAKWYNTLLARCLDQTQDVDEAVRAADLAFSVQSVPLAIEDDNGHWVTKEDGQHVFINKLGELKPSPSSQKVIGKKSSLRRNKESPSGDTSQQTSGITPSQVADIVFNSPNNQLPPDVDKEEARKKFIEHFGVSGTYEKTSINVDALKKDLESGRIKTVKPPDQDEVKRKSASGKFNDVLLVPDKTGQLYILDGTHSLLGAIESGAKNINVIKQTKKAKLAIDALLAQMFQGASFPSHPKDESKPSKDDAEVLFAKSKSLSIAFAHDIFNRKAQGILNKSIAAVKKMNASARIDLEKSLKTEDPIELSRALEAFIRKYRTQLADILTTTQLASLLEGAREVAKKIPTVPMFPGAALPPATLEPVKAVELLDKLRVLPTLEREAEIYKLPGDQQTFVRQGIQAHQQGGNIPPTPFVPASPEGTPERIHYPIIDEAARSLAAKNVMTRAQFDSLDAAARQKAFTVAHVECLDTIDKIRTVMSEVVRDGIDVQTFRERVLAAVDEGTFMSDWHMETVLRTNVQVGFSDGQMAVLQHPFVKSGFPYASYEAIRDDRVRHNHLALESLGIQGTNIYRINDPVFLMFRPPWDWCDRCSWVPMTVRMAASKGIEEAKQWLETGVEPSPPAFVAMPSFRPPAGFQRSLSGMPLSIQLSCEPMAIPKFKRKPG